MNLSKREIEIIQQTIINERNKVSKKISYLEDKIKKIEDKTIQDPLYLKEGLGLALEDKKEYYEELKTISYKLINE